MSCTDVQTIQAGNGTKTQFSFDFPYIFKSEIHVYFWNATTKEWDEKLTTDGTYPWRVTDANPTIVEFTSTAPPSPTTPTDPGEPTVDNVRIRRITNLDDIRALFSPGSAIRSDDLNNNFEQLRYAIQESNCPGVPEDVQSYLEEYYWDRFDNTLYDGNTWVSDDTKIATTAALDDRFWDKDGETITQAEQNAGSPAAADTNVFTALAAARRFDTLVQTATPSGSDWENGKTWYQNDEDKTVFVWDGSKWDAITSGGAFTRLDQVIYVDATNGNDNNNGHRISTPKKTIKSALAAINSDSTFGNGSTILVAPGIYKETAPLDIEKTDVSIIGASVRNVIIHPTEATETGSLFRVNSGSYLANMTFTGMKASGTRGDTGSLWTDSEFGLPPTQGWNVSFLPNAKIFKSPYIQNCTNFSDSEIDNDALDFYTGDSDRGQAGDLDSAPTGGGLLVNGDTVHDDSPLRSMVADSYTHVALDGPGIFVTNNGYAQITSSYAFFNHFHIGCLNGGQANLAASTTDFGRFSLVASGRSTSAIFTATVNGAASSGDETFDIDNVTAGTDWFGNAQRPADNMLVEVGGNTYPILSAEAITGGFRVKISRPDTTDRTNNLGLNGAVADNAAVSFFLRSMIASSGHTMEYVGAGTDYRALPYNATGTYTVGSGTQPNGVPIEAHQVKELNNGKVWAAITDHNGKFRVGDTFSVNQQTGFVSIPAGALSVSTLLEDLDVNGKEIKTDTTNQDIVLNPNGTGVVNVSTSRITNVVNPTGAQDAATKNYVDNFEAQTANIADDAITSDKIGSGAVDSTHLSASTIVTSGEHSSSTPDDISFFTTGASDARYFRQDSSETISSGDTWSGSNSFVATTAAIDARIIDLVDDVGGFVPIADETSFPTANPDVNNGAGTLISIKEIGTSRTPSSGTVTIANGSGSNTVTITGCGTTVLAAGYGCIVETTSTLHTYAFHRLTPLATEVSTVAANVTNISTVAGSINNVNTFANVYQVASANPTTRPGGGALVEGDLYYNTTSDVIRAYNGTAYQNISPDAATLADIAIVADDLASFEDLGSIADALTTNQSGGALETCADNITDIRTLADIEDGTDATDAIQTVAGIASNVTTVANNNANVTAVAGKATEIGRLGTADAVADMAILGTTDAVADMAILGTTDVVADMNTLATTANVANMDTCADDITNINTVAGSISNVNTVASNISNVNSFANTYFISASAPTGSNVGSGDLWYDSTNNTLKFFDGTTWNAISAGIASIADDTTPELGGALDCNNNNLTEVGTVSGDNLQIDFGTI